jgi:hypothetical protein
MIDKVTIELPAIERHLEGVIQMFLQLDKEYLILPLEAMPIYGIMIELNKYIDIKKNQRHLGLAEREWIFEQRQLWQLERQNAFVEDRMPVRFIGRQPNLIDNNLLRENSLNNNSVSAFPLRYFSQDNVQERRHQKRRDKEVCKLSEKLKDQSVRSLAVVTSNNKRIEYFPEENIIIKGSR